MQLAQNQLENHMFLKNSVPNAMGDIILTDPDGKSLGCVLNTSDLQYPTRRVWLRYNGMQLRASLVFFLMDIY